MTEIFLTLLVLLAPTLLLALRYDRLWAGVFVVATLQAATIYLSGCTGLVYQCRTICNALYPACISREDDNDMAPLGWLLVAAAGVVSLVVIILIRVVYRWLSGRKVRPDGVGP